MKMHPREKLVREARSELQQILLDWAKRYDLTTGEELSIIGSTLVSTVGNVGKYMIREERHGNMDTPGGLSSD
jgi:hypothetical protein